MTLPSQTPAAWWASWLPWASPPERADSPLDAMRLEQRILLSASPLAPYADDFAVESGAGPHDAQSLWAPLGVTLDGRLALAPVHVVPPGTANILAVDHLSYIGPNDLAGGCDPPLLIAREYRPHPVVAYAAPVALASPVARLAVGETHTAFGEPPFSNGVQDAFAASHSEAYSPPESATPLAGRARIAMLWDEAAGETPPIEPPPLVVETPPTAEPILPPTPTPTPTPAIDPLPPAPLAPPPTPPAVLPWSPVEPTQGELRVPPLAPADSLPPASHPPREPREGESPMPLAQPSASRAQPPLDQPRLEVDVESPMHRSAGDATADLPEVDAPTVSEPPTITEPPTFTEPAAIDPAGSDPPGSDPAVSDPPVTDPSVTDPPRPLEGDPSLLEPPPPLESLLQADSASLERPGMPWDPPSHNAGVLDSPPADALPATARRADAASADASTGGWEAALKAPARTAGSFALEPALPAETPPPSVPQASPPTVDAADSPAVQDVPPAPRPQTALAPPDAAAIEPTPTPAETSPLDTPPEPAVELDPPSPQDAPPAPLAREPAVVEPAVVEPAIVEPAGVEPVPVEPALSPEDPAVAMDEPSQAYQQALLEMRARISQPQRDANLAMSAALLGGSMATAFFAHWYMKLLNRHADESPLWRQLDFQTAFDRWNAGHPTAGDRAREDRSSEDA